MYKRYLHKYFLNFTIPIDQAMIGAVSTSCGAVFRRRARLPPPGVFAKHWSADHRSLIRPLCLI